VRGGIIGSVEGGTLCGEEEPTKKVLLARPGCVRLGEVASAQTWCRDLDTCNRGGLHLARAGCSTPSSDSDPRPGQEPETVE
jgi:hypothetical protein